MCCDKGIGSERRKGKEKGKNSKQVGKESERIESNKLQQEKTKKEIM